MLSAPQKFGGQFRNKNNQILDFINREEVSHLLPSLRVSKLWKAYDGVVPSEELASALTKISAVNINQISDSLDKAQDALIELVKNQPNLSDHVRKSLLVINDHINGDMITGLSDEATIRMCFINVKRFCQDRQEEMKSVAELMSLQLDIEQYIKRKPNPVELDKLQNRYNILCRNSKLQAAGEGINWIKMSKDTPAFVGNFIEYIAKRSEYRHQSIISVISKSEVQADGVLSEPDNSPIGNARRFIKSI